MTSSLGSLTVDLVVATGGFESGMDKAARTADKKTREIERLAKERAKSIEKAFSAMAAPLATLVGGGTFIALVKGIADTADELAKLSSRVDISVESLSKLRYAASLSDASNEDLSSSLTKLNRVLGEAEDGSKTAADALARFGIKPGTGALEAFEQIAERVKNTGDQTRIASALNDVFGKSWATLVPLLKTGKDGLKQTGDELERMGGVMSGELAVQSEAFNDNITRLKTQMDAWRLQAISPLIPLLLELSNNLATTGDKADGLSTSGQTLKTIFETIAVVGVNTSYVLKGIGNEIGGIAAQINALAHLDFKAFSNIGAAMKKDAEQARKEVDALTNRLLNPYKAVTDGSNYGNEGRGKISAGQGILAAPAAALKPPKAGKAPKAAKDDYSDLLTPAAKAYASALEGIDAALLTAEKSTLDLNSAQSVLYDLMRSPEWAQFPQEWQDIVIAQTAAATAASKTAEDYKRLQAFLAATPTEQLEKTRDDMMFLADAFYAGEISAEQFSEAASTALGNLPDQVKEAADAMDEFAKQAARNMQDAFADFLFDPFKDGLKGMLENFGIMIRRMIANAVAADLSKQIFGKAAGGEGGGLLGAGFDWLKSLAPNAKGGAYESPGLSAYSGSIVTRPTLFAKGAGLMGEAGPEAILPLMRNAEGKLGVSAGGQAGPTINVYVSGTNAPDVRRAAGQGAREALAALSGAKRYG